MNILVLLLILLLVFGTGGYYTHGLQGGSISVGTVLVIILILWLLGVLR